MGISSIHQAIAQDIGSGTLWQLAGTFHYYKDNKAEVYTILAIHPWLTSTQRQVALDQRKHEIIQTLDSIDVNSLHIDVDGKKYKPKDFNRYKQQIKKTLQWESFF